jgi:hypothetical protein
MKKMLTFFSNSMRFENQHYRISKLTHFKGPLLDSNLQESGRFELAG